MLKHTEGQRAVPGANVFRVVALKDGKPYRIIVNDTCPEHAYFGGDDIGWHEGYDDEQKSKDMGEEAAANARLIAAAPGLLKERDRLLEERRELLAAIKRLRACISETRGVDASDAVQAAEAAIAKAERKDTE